MDDEWVTVPSSRKRQITKVENSKSAPPPSMIILIGIPASGKSTFASMLDKSSGKVFARINQDELKTRAKCERACREALANGLSPVIDRCNFSPDQREHFLAIARESNVPCDCVIFKYPLEDCILRAEERSYHETLSRENARGVCMHMHKQLVLPSEETDLEFYRQIHTVTSFRESNAIFAKYLSAIDRE